jgi:hypothetical protein
MRRGEVALVLTVYGIQQLFSVKVGAAFPVNLLYVLSALVGCARRTCFRPIAYGVASRPTGTVSFLFTGITGLTRLWAEAQERMAASLAAHDRFLKTASSGHGGASFQRQVTRSGRRLYRVGRCRLKIIMIYPSSD